MKFMGRLSRLLGRRAEAQIEPENDRVTHAEMPRIANGRGDYRSDFTASPLLHTFDPEEETPLNHATRTRDSTRGDPLTRVDPNLGEQHLDEQKPVDLAISENHLLVTNKLYSSGKPRCEVMPEEVNIEMIKSPTTPETAHKTCGLGSQETFTKNNRGEGVEPISDTVPIEMLGGANAGAKTIHRLKQPAGQSPVRMVRITCPSCAACYEIQRALIPEFGRDMQCSECGNVWFQIPECKDDSAPIGMGNSDQSYEMDCDSSVDYSDAADTDAALREHDAQDRLIPSEIREIIEARLEGMHAFVASQRLHAIDPKGDTPLHLAARVGNLALCDLFIRSGADPEALNYGRQTPADVALAEGHRLAAQLLSSLATNSQEAGSVEAREESPILETPADTSWTEERVELLRRMWTEGRSANHIARELGGVNRDAVLSKAHRLGLWERERTEIGRSGDMTSEVQPDVASPLDAAGAAQRSSSEIAPTAAVPNELDDIDSLLSFEAEEEPEEFFGESTSETASGTFVAIVSPAPAVSDDEDDDWNLDLSPAPIAGEGIDTGATVTMNPGAEYDFLKVRNRGRQSTKRAVVQTGTRLSIDPENCITWAEETLAKGWCSYSDIESLVALCEGNGDLEELHTNLLRNLEAAGFDPVDQSSGHIVGLWDTGSDISSDELAEAIEAALTRSTRLPGTQRFVMDKSDELQLLEPMVRAKQELQLGILASEAAVQTILDVVDSIGGGVRDPSSVSLKTIIPSRLGHMETAEVMAAAEALKFWQANGRVMDGKRRRQALAALESLDLSLAFHKELVSLLEQSQANPEHANWLDTQISVFEAANERLIHEHLPYVRRFAARNVEEGEDPEDVFQVAFMGLQRSTRRFDPERGYRFVVYASYWMRQAIMRWRADEGAAIRIPVHRKEKIARLDLAMEKLDVRADGTVSDNDLAVDLEWTTDEVSQFRAIPREAEYPESTDDWDEVLPEQEDANAFDQAETKRIMTDALAELPEREADIIRMRFGIACDSDMTLEEIGQIYGVTRERIRQIEAKGLDRLSHPGRKRRLQELLGM